MMMFRFFGCVPQCSGWCDSNRLSPKMLAFERLSFHLSDSILNVARVSTYQGLNEPGKSNKSQEKVSAPLPSYFSALEFPKIVIDVSGLIHPLPLLAFFL